MQGNENDDRMRVRRARVADVPRVLRFVREHAKTAWPGLISSPPSASQLVLSDYVARALAQGMLRVTSIHLVLTTLCLQQPHFYSKIRRKRCFTPVFYQAICVTLFELTHSCHSEKVQDTKYFFVDTNFIAQFYALVIFFTDLQDTQC